MGNSKKTLTPLVIVTLIKTFKFCSVFIYNNEEKVKQKRN